MWLTPGRYRGSYITEIQFSVLLKSYLTILLFLKYSSLSCLIRNRYTRASFTSDNNFTFSNLHLKIALCKENYLQCRYNLYIYIQGSWTFLSGRDFYLTFLRLFFGELMQKRCKRELVLWNRDNAVLLWLYVSVHVRGTEHLQHLFCLHLHSLL